MDTGLNTERTECTELKQRALALYRAPFRVEEGAIYDAAGHMVADDREGVLRVRGWGRIGYLKDGAALQDMVGELLVEALNAYWGRAADPEGQAQVTGQDAPAAPDPAALDPATAAIERASQHYGVPAALLQSLADKEAGLNPATQGDAAPAPDGQPLPHLEGHKPTPLSLSDYADMAVSMARLLAASLARGPQRLAPMLTSEGLPPPDYYVSSQHGKLLAAYAYEEPNDPAYRWQPVWGAPVYEQNAQVRGKAAQLDELLPQLEHSGYATVHQAVAAALSAAQLSDELIAGVGTRFGLAGVAPALQVRAVREVLRCAGIERSRNA